MNIKILKFIIVLSILFNIHNSCANANYFFNNGTIHVRGDITTATCVALIGGSTHVIKMRWLYSEQLNSIRILTNSIPFEISFPDCHLNIGISFNGEADEKNKKLFKIGSNIKSSSGMGLGIFDVLGNIIPPNQGVKCFEGICPEDMTHHFMASFIATSNDVSQGNVNAIVALTLSYN